MSQQGPSGRRSRWVRGLLILLGAITWLFTAGLGLVEIYLSRQMVVRIWGRFSTDVPMATLAGHVMVVIMALAWLTYVIFAGEIGLKRIASNGGWTIFAWAVAIELLILILYFLV
ncbi:MAG TPA: hypothetical protein DEQ80_05515 [Anaerolinea thermolimosa]|uniref:Heme-copper oxidase subunit III family profile domain-containing protein n=1 Tax=Anaerolinea thermolimosa TaxID=229919 RepID=A0A3D1JHP9_9CHLR|nr:hypothetical protein [Anaerolinea thermolimosa]GAP05756.1 hypothetical protein ATHL_00597 [Anaerolinea thermolimosa]HCE17298.1 hypothetical protein [Anaerolinea thermolimosa]